MGKLFISMGIGLAAGFICFFLSVAFLSLLLLLVRAISHLQPDMTLAYKAALPVAIFAAFAGFTITLVRAVRGQAFTK